MKHTQVVYNLRMSCNQACALAWTLGSFPSGVQVWHEECPNLETSWALEWTSQCTSCALPLPQAVLVGGMGHLTLELEMGDVASSIQVHLTYSRFVETFLCV